MDETVDIMLREKRAPEPQICFFLSFFISVMLKKTSMKEGVRKCNKDDNRTEYGILCTLDI